MNLQRWLRKWISLLPKVLRFWFNRRLIRLNYDLDPQIVFKVAETESELAQAFKVLHDAYVEVDFMKPSSDQMRITDYHFEPSSVVLIAKYKAEVIGTCTVIKDSKKGFPADKIVDLSVFRKNKETLAEMSALAVRKEWRGKIYLYFIKYQWEFCQRVLKVDTTIAVTRTGASDFYEGILFFKPISLKKIENYNFANNITVECFAGHLKNCSQKMMACYNSKPLNRNFYFFLRLLKVSGFDFCDTEYLPLVNPCWNSPLLVKQGDVKGHQKRLPYEYKTQITLANEDFEAEIENISREGIKIRLPAIEHSPCDEFLNAQTNIKNIDFILQLADRKKSQLQAQVIWNNLHQEFGLKIIKTDHVWRDFINYLKLTDNHANFSSRQAA